MPINFYQYISTSLPEDDELTREFNLVKNYNDEELYVYLLDRFVYQITEKGRSFIRDFDELIEKLINEKKLQKNNDSYFFMEKYQKLNEDDKKRIFIELRLEDQYKSDIKYVDFFNLYLSDLSIGKKIREKIKRFQINYSIDDN